MSHPFVSHDCHLNMVRNNTFHYHLNMPNSYSTSTYICNHTTTLFRQSKLCTPTRYHSEPSPSPTLSTSKVGTISSKRPLKNALMDGNPDNTAKRGQSYQCAHSILPANCIRETHKRGPCNPATQHNTTRASALKHQLNSPVIRSCEVCASTRPPP